MNIEKMRDDVYDCMCEDAWSYIRGLSEIDLAELYYEQSGDKEPFNKILREIEDY